MLDATAVFAVVEAAAFAVVLAMLTLVVAATLTLVVARVAVVALPALLDAAPPTGFPFVPICCTAAKLVVLPKAALNASA